MLRTAPNLMQMLKDAKWSLPWLEKNLWSAPIPSTSSQISSPCPLMETLEILETLNFILQTNYVLYTICTVYAVSIQKFNFDFDCVVHNGKRNKAQFCHSSSDLRHILFRIYFIFMATWWCTFHYLFQGFASPSPAIWSTEWGAATAR